VLHVYMYRYVINYHTRRVEPGIFLQYIEVLITLGIICGHNIMYDGFWYQEHATPLLILRERPSLSVFRYYDVRHDPCT
jgi:hypothetical protein